MQILKKMSVATAISGSRTEFKNFEKVTPVLRVFGIVREYIEDAHPQYGKFYKFKGDFRSVDLRDGTESVSSVAFFPAPIDELLAEQVASTIASGDKGAMVELAIDISVQPDPASTVGYQYVVVNLEEMKVSDPMQALLNRVSNTPLLKSDNPFGGDKETPIESVESVVKTKHKAK